MRESEIRSFSFPCSVHFLSEALSLVGLSFLFSSVYPSWSLSVNTSPYIDRDNPYNEGKLTNKSMVVSTSSGSPIHNTGISMYGSIIYMQYIPRISSHT